jgi:hypothetical protein
MNGRAEIASTLRGIFENHPTASYVAKVRDVRAIAPGDAIIRSVVGRQQNELKGDSVSSSIGFTVAAWARSFGADWVEAPSG